MGERIVIIGSGLGGYSLARELRKIDQAVSLTMVTRDDGAFYSKPMLSNALDKGKTADTLITADADKMRSDLQADIHTHTTVTGIDPHNRQLTLHTGETVAYSQLVLAIGAEAVRPVLKGDATDSVCSVNSLEDYRHFRERIDGKQRIAIIGPGLIGCEFANDLVRVGYEVHVIGPDPWPLGRLLPAEAGAAVRDALEAAGVNWHLQRMAQAVRHDGDQINVEMDNERQVQVDVVLSAIGLHANTELARAAGLTLNRGIVVDRFLRSSDPAIYALGDCAEVEGLLLPFVMPLMQQARVLAATLTGSATQVSYPAMPVLVKTTSYPVVVAPPPYEATGAWQETIVEGGVRALFKSGEEVLGAALTGSAVSERQSLLKVLPKTLA